MLSLSGRIDTIEPAPLTPQILSNHEAFLLSLAIAVDARPLAHEHSGISVYLREVLSQLIPDSPHQWFLYTDRPFHQEPDWNQAITRTGRCSSRLMSSLYAQIHFGRWAHADKCDLFWSPRHQLPRLLGSSIPCVVTLHDLVFSRFPETMTLPGRILERLLTPSSLSRANSILTISHAVKKELEAFNPQLTDRIHMVPLASNIDTIKSDKIESAGDGRPSFIYCGSLEPRKNLERLISAFLRLKARPDAPPHKMVLVSGGGWNNDRIKQLLDSAPEHFELHSGVSEAHKAALIRQSDFLALPSLYEGFGIPLVEAFRLDRPVLTSNNGAMLEVAGSAAVLVDPLDQNSIEDALERLCSDTRLRARLSIEARNRAKQFCWKRTARQTLAVLEATATPPD